MPEIASMTPVVLIAPPPIARDLVKLIDDHCDEPYEVFDSIPHFGTALAKSLTRTGAIHNHVLDALSELELTLTSMSPRMRGLFTAMMVCSVTPRVPQLETWIGSGRTLYRVWCKEVPESPARFLRRVRLHHAVDLLQAGLKQEDVAELCGYSSPSSLSRALGGIKTRDGEK